jgi:hypothetical protein
MNPGPGTPLPGPKESSVYVAGWFLWKSGMSFGVSTPGDRERPIFSLGIRGTSCGPGVDLAPSSLAPEKRDRLPSRNAY